MGLLMYCSGSFVLRPPHKHTHTRAIPSNAHTILIVRANCLRHHTYSPIFRISLGFCTTARNITRAHCTQFRFLLATPLTWPECCTDARRPQVLPSPSESKNEPNGLRIVDYRTCAENGHPIGMTLHIGMVCGSNMRNFVCAGRQPRTIKEREEKRTTPAITIANHVRYRTIRKTLAHHERRVTDTQTRERAHTRNKHRKLSHRGENTRWKIVEWSVAGHGDSLAEVICSATDAYALDGKAELRASFVWNCSNARAPPCAMCVPFGSCCCVVDRAQNTEMYE